MKKSIIYFVSTVFIACAFIFTSGCSKDMTVNTIYDSVIIHNHDTVTNTVWLLEYNQQSGGNQIYYAPQTFIKNGLAYFPTNLSHSVYWVADYSIAIPKEIILNIDTDSLTLTARIRNISGDGTANEMDLSLRQTSTNMAFASWQKGINPTFCRLGVSGQLVSNLAELLTDPSTYAEYSINVSDNKVVALKNSTSLKSVPYTGSLGKLGYIGVLFRGYGEIDWIKLYKGNKLIMSEDFNVDGTTTAIWSKP